MILVLPPKLPVTIPDEFTLAMVREPLDHVPVPGVPVRNIDDASQTLLGPAVMVGNAFIVIGHEVWQPVDKP